MTAVTRSPAFACRATVPPQPRISSSGWAAMTRMPLAIDDPHGWARLGSGPRLRERTVALARPLQRPWEKIAKQRLAPTACADARAQRLQQPQPVGAQAGRLVQQAPRRARGSLPQAGRGLTRAGHVPLEPRVEVGEGWRRQKVASLEEQDGRRLLAHAKRLARDACRLEDAAADRPAVAGVDVPRRHLARSADPLSLGDLADPQEGHGTVQEPDAQAVFAQRQAGLIPTHDVEAGGVNPLPQTRSPWNPVRSTRPDSAASAPLKYT